MALQIAGLPRKFKIETGNQEIEVDDPNITFSPEQVRDLLAAGDYPSLTAASVTGPVVDHKREVVLYTISAKVGDKG